jgi:DNA-binding NarL/FixJ family response regulator
LLRPKPKKTILLIDNNKRFLSLARRYLESVGNFDVVGTISDATQAVKKAQFLQPDIITLDLSMPEIDGLDLIVPLKKACNHTIIIVLTMMDEEPYRDQVLRRGADGFVTKDTIPNGLIQQIERCMKLE